MAKATEKQCEHWICKKKRNRYLEGKNIMNILPKDFYFVVVDDHMVEICPGVCLAVGEPFYRAIHGLIPPRVAYCYVEEFALLSKGIRRVPFNLVNRIPNIKGCQPLMLPHSLELAPGIRLIQGVQLPRNIVLPLNIMVIQTNLSLKDSTKMIQLPKGMNLINMSPLYQNPKISHKPSLFLLESLFVHSTKFDINNRNSILSRFDIRIVEPFTLFLAQVHSVRFILNTTLS